MSQHLTTDSGRCVACFCCCRGRCGGRGACGGRRRRRRRGPGREPPPGLNPSSRLRHSSGRRKGSSTGGAGPAEGPVVAEELLVGAAASGGAGEDEGGVGGESALAEVAAELPVAQPRPRGEHQLPVLLLHPSPLPTPAHPLCIFPTSRSAAKAGRASSPASTSAPSG